ncbi:hypothetical protein GCM10007939_08320 [Amylibacter marinus]|uniref:YjiS-like domain-containing protein n=1 Tax=Amylibacter marinus TaxID=1475483 RepID=A0ABQ5VTR4_9RHOB|nr:DUF1127 domain-containing protein [Amylibacter marinus]GLQ34549.1 hypothetical protein GCM10007939_08320 [Amylibacter marinus]
MAYITQNHATPSVFAGIISAFNALKARYEANRVYAKTVSELSALTARDLADLNINRADIRRIAREAAYGA